MLPPSNITGGPTEKVFSARILGKYQVDYFRCRDTGYIQTETPYWLEEAYASPMNLSDTGILTRTAYVSRILRKLIGGFFGETDVFLDFAGGYGTLTRAMRDAGVDYYWDDPYTKNILARGFEHIGGGRSYAAVSAVEVFEHFVSPRIEIEKLFKLAPNIFFSTSLVPEPLPSPGSWWYYGTEHGQHVSFYTRSALEFIAGARGYDFASNGRDLHFIFEKNRLPVEIEAKWMKKWLQEKDREVVQAFGCCYEFIELKRKKARWARRVKEMFRGKRHGVYVLDPTRPSEEKELLLRAGFGTAYANYLLDDGYVDEQRLSERFRSKTETDWAMLCARRAEKTGAT